MSLDAGNRSDSWLGVTTDPAIMNKSYWYRVEVVVLGATLFHSGHQFGLFENAEMVHDSISGHPGEVGAQLAEGLTILLEQFVKQQSSAGVAYGSEYLIHAVHYM
jgi:hypothetical protein